MLPLGLRRKTKQAPNEPAAGGAIKRPARPLADMVARGRARHKPTVQAADANEWAG